MAAALRPRGSAEAPAASEADVRPAGGESGVAAGDTPSELDAASEREAWALLMSVHGLGPKGFAALLAAYGTGRAVLEAAGRRGAAARFNRIAADAEGRAPFGTKVGDGVAELAAEIPDRLARLRSSGLRILTLDDDAYPGRLRAIELPPPVILVRGAIESLEARRVVSIVGTRRPTEQGRLVAARIGGLIARAGGLVVSGLAIGIDGAAHAAVVAEAARTVAVLGSGHDRLFPRAHVRLAGEIVAAGGAVISELWPDQRPSVNTFPQRNRVISGLADATVVVEAGLRSGALITAHWALEQGRGLFMVPGPITEPRSAGCLAWLRAYPGEARIVATVAELIADLGLLDVEDDLATDPGHAKDKRQRPSIDAELLELGPTAESVGRALVAGSGSLDELVAATSHEPATVLSAITLLELRGLVTTTYGRYRAAGRLASAPVPRLPHRDSPC